VTQQARHGDRHLYAQRTRFISRAMLPLYDDVLWPALKPLDAERFAPKASIDLRAQMRGMWAK
jgi:DNA helicase-2/ATP-dependent DNA helicase PcrA